MLTCKRKSQINHKNHNFSATNNIHEKIKNKGSNHSTFLALSDEAKSFHRSYKPKTTGIISQRTKTNTSNIH